MLKNNKVEVWVRDGKELRIFLAQIEVAKKALEDMGFTRITISHCRKELCTYIVLIGEKDVKPI